eukprot:13421_4
MTSRGSFFSTYSYRTWYMSLRRGLVNVSHGRNSVEDEAILELFDLGSVSWKEQEASRAISLLDRSTGWRRRQDRGAAS